MLQLSRRARRNAGGLFAVQRRSVDSTAGKLRGKARGQGSQIC